MGVRRHIILATVLGVFVAACTDVLDVPPAPESDIAVHDASAPELETNAASFWAVQGRSTVFRVRYVRPVEPEADTLPAFLALTISQRAQMLGPDGTPLARGDSIQISVDIDPEMFMVEFSPDGLVFAADDPMELKFWYGFAELTDQDGTLRDESTLSMLYRDKPGDPWIPIESEVSLQGNFIVADVYHFSGYAVAW